MKVHVSKPQYKYLISINQQHDTENVIVKSPIRKF